VSSRRASVSVPFPPSIRPDIAATLAKLAEKAATAAPRVAGAAALAGTLLLTPGNTQSETHPITDDLRVRTAPGQRSATVEQRVDNGLLGTGIGAKWKTLPVDAGWSTGPDGRYFIAIDPAGLARVLTPDEMNAVLRTPGIAMTTPPSDRTPDDERRPAGIGHNSESFHEKLQPEAPEPGDPKPPLDPTPLVLPALAVPGRVRSRINLSTGNRYAGWTHVAAEHFNPARSGKSQFTISQSELRHLLQTREVIGSPVVRVLQSSSGPVYVREVTLDGRIIGTDVTTKSPTSTFTIMTDGVGNLVTTFPGRIK
jgi:hypothetical protein